MWIYAYVQHMYRKDSIPDQLEFDINSIKKIHIHVELTMN